MASWAPPGHVLVALGSLLGALWALPWISPPLSKYVLYVFAHFICLFLRFCAFPRVSGCFRALGVILDARGALLGVLGALLDALGALLGALGALLDALGALFERAWGALGAMLGLACKKSRKIKRYPKFWLQLGRKMKTKIIENRC